MLNPIKKPWDSSHHQPDEKYEKLIRLEVEHLVPLLKIGQCCGGFQKQGPRPGKHTENYGKINHFIAG